MAGNPKPAAGETPYTDPAPFEVAARGLQLGFYPGGPDRLERLLRLADEARVSLKLAFYIFTMDECAQRFRDALVRAAKRGVAVTLILDSFGAVASDAFLAPLVGAGGRVLRFSPRWNVRYLIRNHQKIVIADDSIGMIGGFNIEKAYFDPPEANGWNDLAVTVSGPAVDRLVEWFAGLEHWTASRHSQFFALRRMVRDWQPGNGGVRWLVGGPTHWPSSWRRRVTVDLEWGRRLDMVMAYFSPPPRLVRLIGAVARRSAGPGTGTRLVLPAKSDHPVTIWASRAVQGKLLACGAEIYEFQACKLHTKLIAIDDVVYIGSANFDMRSLYLNLELMLRIEDAALADRVRGFIAELVPASERITPELYARRRTLWDRIRWRLSWFLVNVVDYTVSRRFNLGPLRRVN